jgi:uncharacterized protein
VPGAQMSKSPSYLKQLRNELLDLEDSMLLEELDGFAAGLVVCPDVILPSEWLPVVWGLSEEAEAPIFETLDHANKVIALVMGHYNHVARMLSETPERYRPLLTKDERNGDIFWEFWIEGFEKAMKLRPAAWLPLLEADAETSFAIRGLLTLADVARRDERLPLLKRRELEEDAPELIGPWLLAINDWRIENYDPETGTSQSHHGAVAPSGNVGRNDPCPCGSGKKYKKCCGLN